MHSLYLFTLSLGILTWTTQYRILQTHTLVETPSKVDCITKYILRLYLLLSHTLLLSEGSRTIWTACSCEQWK